MFFCRKLTQEEIVEQKYNFTGYNDAPTTPYFIITNNDKNIELFITSLPSHHRIGKGALVIGNHVCAIAFREDFFDKVSSGNLRQTWEIFHITIYSILRETQTIFGEQQNKELVYCIVEN